MFNLVDLPNVLTAEQCSHLIEHHRHGLKPSAVAAPRTSEYIAMPAMRTSFSYKLPAVRDDIAEKLRSVIAETTGAPSERTETWELLHYEVGGFFNPHDDWLHPVFYGALLKNGGQRTHSAILYLSDVERGGETVFPNIGITITPKQGLFISWNNTHKDGDYLPQARHEGRPVLAGEKWVLVTWVRERPCK